MSVESDNEKKKEIINHVFDENYDHYYDDVPVAELEDVDKEIDKETIKKIAILVGIVAVVVIICGIFIRNIL